MQINTLKIKTARKKKKIIGRGGKKGTYSGKGNKGQKARSGAKVDPLFEGGRSTLIDHMKKKRGFKSLVSKPAVVKLADLNDNFKDGESVTIEALAAKNLIRKIQSSGVVKILDNEEVKVKIVIAKGIKTSASAKAAIEKAGGKVE